MPRRKALIAAGALGAAAIVFATGTGDASATPRFQTQTFQAQATAQPVTAGTGFVIADQDVAGSTVIGHDVVSCTVESAGASCDVAFAQTGGLLYAHLTIRDADGSLAGIVTGGTDRFRHAHGTLTGTTLSPTDVQITLHYVG
jgi:hypothetical protein